MVHASAFFSAVNRCKDGSCCGKQATRSRTGNKTVAVHEELRHKLAHGRPIVPGMDGPWQVGIVVAGHSIG